MFRDHYYENGKNFPLTPNSHSYILEFFRFSRCLHLRILLYLSLKHLKSLKYQPVHGALW